MVFSLPEGRFRFDESLGIFGDQLVGEFFLVTEEPRKAIAYSAEPVNEWNYFYDVESFREEYLDSLNYICDKYDLECPRQPLDWHDWETKRFAIVVTLVDDWYNPSTNEPYAEVWGLADAGLEDFKLYEDAIYEYMEGTEPLMVSGT
jgi:hypothetical protein